MPRYLRLCGCSQATEDTSNGTLEARRSLVLVIDDEDDMRALLVDLFASEGIETTAVGQFEALMSVQQLRPKVVVLDIMMPGVGGYDILRSLRSDPELGRPYVLMLTGNVQTRDVETGLNLGADDYVKKPFAVAELLARVRAGLAWSARR